MQEDLINKVLTVKYFFKVGTTTRNYKIFNGRELTVVHRRFNYIQLSKSMIKRKTLLILYLKIFNALFVIVKSTLTTY